jgi:GR25 family glycosyltransferase involved in LPS biosynthesis
MNIQFILLIILLLILFFIIHIHLDKIKHESIMNFKQNTKCHVINLDKNIERLSRFIKSYYESDLNEITITRFNAVNGREINIQKYVNKNTYDRIDRIETDKYRLYHYELTRGAVGCFLSHMEIYKKLVQDNDVDYYIVFEDDVLIPKKCIHNIENYIANAPDNWDILLLGTSMNVTIDNYVMYKKIKSFWGLHSYVIRKSGARKFLEEMKKQKYIHMQIDSMMSIMAGYGKLDIYMTRVNLFGFQPESKTDIQIPVKQMYDIDPFSYPVLLMSE